MQDGNKVVQLSIATSEVWKDKNTGERRDRTEWNRVVVFNERLADICEKYLKKGSKVYIEGQLQTRKWTDNSGQERYTTEIVLQKYRGELTMLDNKSDTSMVMAEPAYDASYSAGDETTSTNGSVSHDLDDEIPF